MQSQHLVMTDSTELRQRLGGNKWHRLAFVMEDFNRRRLVQLILCYLDDKELLTFNRVSRIFYDIYIPNAFETVPIMRPILNDVVFHVDCKCDDGTHTVRVQFFRDSAKDHGLGCRCIIE